MGNNPVTAEAYERKASLGGGFRAIVVDRRNSTRHESDILDSRAAAITWARRKVFEIMGDTPWRPGYIYRPTWRLHVWV